MHYLYYLLLIIVILFLLRHIIFNCLKLRSVTSVKETFRNGKDSLLILFAKWVGWGREVYKKPKSSNNFHQLEQHSCSSWYLQWSQICGTGDTCLLMQQQTWNVVTRGTNPVVSPMEKCGGLQCCGIFNCTMQSEGKVCLRANLVGSMDLFINDWPEVCRNNLLTSRYLCGGTDSLQHSLNALHSQKPFCHDLPAPSPFLGLYLSHGAGVWVN